MLSNLLPVKWSDIRIFPSRMTTSQKILCFTVAASLTAFTIMSRYFRRRKPRKPPRRVRRYTGRRTRSSMRSPNDILSLAGSKTSARSGSPLGSTIYSDRMSLASGSIGAGVLVSSSQSQTGAPAVQLTSQQLGVLGMEALDMVINYWEDALQAQLNSTSMPNPLTSADESEFCREIQNLLDMAFALQDQSELLFLDQRSVLFRDEQSIDEGDDYNLRGLEDIHEDDVKSQKSVSLSLRSRAGSDPNIDSAESFASALDQIADMREFDDFIDYNYDEFPFFQSALKQHEENPIPVRSMRTELVNCNNDNEYAAKLHCVRLAFQYLFKDPSIVQWVADTGRQILTDLLCLGDKDTKEFLIGYEEIINYVQNPANWAFIEEELQARNVKAFTFYDICIDFIILDSFRDLDSPPSTVISVVQNRFLSKSFKESALSTAVWSVLKAKKRMLKLSNGFMWHFYVISEQISPLMAWGFFGPDEGLKDICQYFRDQTLGFLTDIFSFQKSRYTTLEEFAEDVLSHMRNRINNIGVKFSQ